MRRILRVRRHTHRAGARTAAGSWAGASTAHAGSRGGRRRGGCGAARHSAPASRSARTRARVCVRTTGAPEGEGAIAPVSPRRRWRRGRHVRFCECCLHREDFACARVGGLLVVAEQPQHGRHVLDVPRTQRRVLGVPAEAMWRV
eukprot:7377266-Prymnesium_polylepis.3